MFIIIFIIIIINEFEFDDLKYCVLISVLRFTKQTTIGGFTHIFHPILEESYQVATSVTNPIADCFQSTSSDNNSISSTISPCWT